MMRTMPYRKTYLSLSVSRALQSEYPIGDPYGGPAYGEKNAPAVIAVVAFVAANAGTIALVGMAMNVVGAVTGNATLSKIGTVMSLVGGGFSLAQSGAFNFIDTGIQDWSLAAAKGFETTAQNLSATAGLDIDVVGGTGGAETGLVKGAETQVGEQLNLAAATKPAAEASQGLINAPSVTAPADVSADIAAGIADANAAGAVTEEAGTALVESAAATGVAEAPLDVAGEISKGRAAADLAASDTGVSGNVLGEIGKWINDNKGIAEVGLNFGYKALSGNNNEGDEHLKNTQANILQQQLSNASAIPDITKMFKTNPNAKIAKPAPLYAPGMRPAGLIQARG